jgi:hypothetical protein
VGELQGCGQIRVREPEDLQELAFVQPNALFKNLLPCCFKDGAGSGLEVWLHRH